MNRTAYENRVRALRIDLYRRTEAAMTPDERRRFSAGFVRVNPRWEGAHVIAMLDQLDSMEAHDGTIETMFEQRGIAAEPSTDAVAMATLCRIYMDGVALALWPEVRELARRIDAQK